MSTMTEPEGPRSGDAVAPRQARPRWMTAAAAVVLFGSGLGVGAALPADTAELDAAHAETQSSQQTVTALKTQLADAQEQNSTLTGSLAAAEERLETAETATKATQDRLDARALKLDKRAKAVQEREAAVSAREAAVEAQDVAVRPESDGPSSPDFDRAYALDIANDIVEDIRSVDERLGDGIMVSSALSMLADSYGRLMDAGFPPGVDESEYYGRLTTLQSFAEQAANTYDDNPTEGSARFAVIRKETGVLFDTLNSALGSQLRLP